MMRIQEGWLPIGLALLCLLCCSIAGQEVTPVTETAATSTTSAAVDDVPGVKPLEVDGASRKQSAAEKLEADSKSIEAKKKTIADFAKPKPEPVKKPLTKDVETSTTSEKPIAPIPVLLRGEPIAATTTVASAEETKKPEDALPITTTETLVSRARALNVSAAELANVLHSNVTDLSDVSMDDEDKEVEGGEYIAAHNGTANNATMARPVPTVEQPMCVDGNETYAVGRVFNKKCEICVCEKDGKLNCDTLPCRDPYLPIGSITDPYCTPIIEHDPCCVAVACADSAPEPEETCVFGNSTVARGQKVEDGCEKTCICEAGGHLKCQPRCLPNDTASGIKQHDRCVVLQDPSDSCCTITLCDVTLGDHEIKAETPVDLAVNLTDVKVLNSTAIKLKLSSKSPNDVTVELSENNHVWRQVKPTKDGIISNLQPAHSYYVRMVEGSRTGPAIHVSLLAEVIKTSVTEKSEKGSCSHRGKTYKIGAEWYDECIAYCLCNETAQTECVTIECPTDFGLDVLDPHCLDWETVPPNHIPKAPNCCPHEVRCRNNGSCTYEGKMYDNWSRLPTNITGCEKECFCEFGNVTCSAACPPVTSQPPTTLNCKAHEAILTHLPGDDCCMHWVCAQSETNAPGFEQHGVPPPLGQFPSQQAYEISVEDLRAISGNTVRLMFTVPSVLVGLHGRVEVRYTSDSSNPEPATWKSQTFAPPGDLIDTEDLEFDLSGLKPSTVYRLMIVVKLRDLSNTHTSKIYQIRTLDKQSTLPSELRIDSELKLVTVNSTFAEFEWRKFTIQELQVIDGVYLMYKAVDEKIYSVTPLLHRSVNRYVLDHLRPLTTYEVHLSTKDIIDQPNVLIDSKTINFTTTAESDPYSFDVRVDIKTIKSTEVEVSWSGVPLPQEKYVNIFRAVYQSDTGKEDTSTFKIAKKDSPAKTIIGELKPGTRYRLWIEVYLTNGKIKKSNVQDFVTKPGVLLPPGASQQQGKLASIPLHEGDYYGPLVIVAIVASLAILSTLILLMMLMKRRTSSKADISPRKTTSAYDNPSYKVELQQETMDL